MSGAPTPHGREPLTDAARALIRNERVKLTATYLNTAAGALFAAGVVAPLAAALFGFVAQPETLTLGFGALTFLVGSIGLHGAARYILKGLR